MHRPLSPNHSFQPLDITLNIAENLKDQFNHAFKLIHRDGEYFLNPSIGRGKGMEFVQFPGQLEFYHFKKSFFNVPVHMKSVNALDSKWFLIHINLSQTKQKKKVENQEIEFQKHLPAGILLYGPGLEIDTRLPPDTEMELASLRFSHDFLDTYFGEWKRVIDTSKNLVYEDLDYALEGAIDKALLHLKNKMACHAGVLRFIRLFYEKLSTHSKTTHHKKLHTEDVKNLFAASVLLRNPTARRTHSVDELAAIANMSKTKFKTTFKQLFGSAPLQYRHKIRMEFAREALAAKSKTPTELSYDLGYAHPSNFTSAYKRFFGVLPSSEH